MNMIGQFRKGTSAVLGADTGKCVQRKIAKRTARKDLPEIHRYKNLDGFFLFTGFFLTLLQFHESFGHDRCQEGGQSHLIAMGSLQEQIDIKYSGCDVELQYGGQPIYYYVISAE